MDTRLPERAPRVSSQADAVAKGQRIAANAQGDVARILAEVVTVAEGQARRVRRVDDFWTRGRDRNTEVRESAPATRWCPSYAELRARLRDITTRGLRVSYSEARVNGALKKVDRAVLRAASEAEAVIDQASRELFALALLYGDDSPMWQGVYNAVLTRGPRGLQFDLACEAARKMVKARGTDQVVGTYTDERGKQQRIPSTPRAISESLNDAVAASASIADATRALANTAKRIAFWSRLGHEVAFWRERNVEPTWALRRYAKAEARAFRRVNAALVGATRNVTAWQGLYPRSSDFFTGALDAVQPSMTLYQGFKEGSKAAKALVRTRGDALLADSVAPLETPHDPRHDVATEHVDTPHAIAVSGGAPSEPHGQG